MDINNLITEATKNKDREKLGVLRLIKAEFLKAEKSGKPWDEIKILQKMAEERKDSIRQYTAAGRIELAKEEENELKIIETFLPKMPSEDELREYIREVLSAENNLAMKDMKRILGIVNEKYPGVNGKIVSEELKKYIS